MASTKEALVKQRIKAVLDAHGAYRVMPVSNGMGAHGVPDFLVCARGMFIGIEAKAGKGRPTELQLSNLRRIHEAGGSALVINEINVGLLDGMLHALKVGGTPFSNYDVFERHQPEGDDAPKKRIKQEKKP